jgi:hypothetical protein
MAVPNRWVILLQPATLWVRTRTTPPTCVNAAAYQTAGLFEFYEAVLAESIPFSEVNPRRKFLYCPLFISATPERDIDKWFKTDLCVFQHPEL